MPQAINGRKVCSKCKIEKDVGEFGKCITRLDGLEYSCKDCKSKRAEVYRKENKDIIAIKREGKKEKHKKYCLEYYKLHRQSIIIQNVTYKRNRRRIDSSYNMLSNLRRRMQLAVQGKYKKVESTMKLVGCSLDYLKNHLQQTAINNGYIKFDINKYNAKEFHVDHIIPVAAFNMSCGYHQRLCFNWKNLQILRAEENLSKSDSIINN